MAIYVTGILDSDVGEPLATTRRRCEAEANLYAVHAHIEGSHCVENVEMNSYHERIDVLNHLKIQQR